MSKPPLTRREREIMDVLYKLGRATVHEVLAQLADPPSYSTVRALLRLLEERGHVRHTEEGTRYVFAPAISRGKARQQALAHVVATFFGGSVGDAMLSLVESSGDKLSEEELERLAQVVAQARKEGR